MAARFQKLREQLAPEIEEILGEPLSASDFQSTLCECDKLERYRIDGGNLRPYTPYGQVRSKARRAAKPAVAVEESSLPPIPHAIPELAAARDPNVPHLLFHDLETRSVADLKASAHEIRRRSEHRNSMSGLRGRRRAGAVMGAWRSCAVGILEAAKNSKWLIVAHNDAFEHPIAQHILEPRHGFPTIPIERRRCRMAMALANALPGSLEGAAQACGLPYRKDTAGYELMLRMAKPRKDGGWFDDPKRRERLYRYCATDEETERALYQALPPLSSEEEELRRLDAAINQRRFSRRSRARRRRA